MAEERNLGMEQVSTKYIAVWNDYVVTTKSSNNFLNLNLFVGVSVVEVPVPVPPDGLQGGAHAEREG